MTDAREFARLRWRCRRGMRELDVLMSGWLDQHYESASAGQQAAFRELLEQPDPLLLAWLTGREKPTEAALGRLVDAIRAST